jgi:hypothetical protein
MLNRRRSSGLARRVITSAVALALIAPLVAGGGPANADEPPADTSPIGDGGISPPEEFIPVTSGDGGETELTVGGVRDDACQTLVGVVAPSDIPERYRSNPPAGEGAWEYQVCAETAEAARTIRAAHPDFQSARRFCQSGADELNVNKCAVFVFWRPKQPQSLPRPPDEGRDNYFQSFFTLSPQIGNSPHKDAPFGYVTNFPTWFWNRVETRFPRPLGDFGFFGGFAATAFHLETTFETDGHEVCDVGGFRLVGTEWRAGRHAPDQESPDCGYTYTNMGAYEVEACTTWLIIAVGPFFAIVFPITLCNTWGVNVKESQILTGGDATRARVN